MTKLKLGPICDESRDDDDHRRRRVAPEPLQQLRAVSSRHAQVTQDDVVGLGPQTIDGMANGARRTRLHSCFAQATLDRETKIDFVVDDEHPHGMA